MSHEFTGEVVDLGSEVKTIIKGDLIVTPFAFNCGPLRLYATLKVQDFQPRVRRLVHFIV
jgi:threonine dehydrogenase-like Zn-dependent dehydrogenase